MTRAKSADVLGADFEAERGQVIAQIARAVGIARMPQDVEKGVELPPIGITKRRATLGRGLVFFQEGERFVEMLERSPPTGGHGQFQKLDTRPHQRGRGFSGCLPFMREQEDAEIDRARLIVAHKRSDFIPSQAAIAAGRYLFAQAARFLAAGASVGSEITKTAGEFCVGRGDEFGEFCAHLRVTGEIFPQPVLQFRGLAAERNEQRHRGRFVGVLREPPQQRFIVRCVRCFHG